MPYYKMKGDYDRYLAESANRGMKSKSAEDACVAYAEPRRCRRLWRFHRRSELMRPLMCQVCGKGKFPPFKLGRMLWKVPQFQFFDRVIDVLVSTQT